MVTLLRRLDECRRSSDRVSVNLMRPLLQRQLTIAWSNSINKDYCARRINSERSLQASFWSQLNLVLHPKNRRMFIEPRFVLDFQSNAVYLIPDIVICNTKSVIAVIELKYQPRVLPSYKKDIETLQLLSKHREHLSFANNRFRGVGGKTIEYPFSESVLFVWAGVHRKPIDSYLPQSVPMLSTGIHELDGCFLQLHAETEHGKTPNVFRRFRT